MGLGDDNALVKTIMGHSIPVQMPETDIDQLSKLGDPVLAVIEDNFALESLDDFLIVQEDKFRTGYECKACDGEGHTSVVCKRCNGTRTESISDVCDNCQGSGKSTSSFRAFDGMTNVVKKCSICDGSGKIDLKGMDPGLYPCRNCIVVLDISGRTAPCGFEPCAVCKGKGMSLYVPDDSVRRPNSGIIRSIGPKVTRVSCGDRVMYSNHTGYEIYFKRGLKFRQMREHEVMARIHGVKKLHQVLE